METLDLPKSSISHSLDDEEVIRLTGNSCKFILYPDLANYDTIDQALAPYKCAIMLYLSEKNYGHYTCIFIRDKNTIEFFDPYGIVIDGELNFVSPEKNRELDQDYAYLSHMLVHSPYRKFIYNNYPFQQLGEGVNTCGRWSALRIIFKDLTLAQFKKKFYDGIKNRDAYVTYLTNGLF